MQATSGNRPPPKSPLPSLSKQLPFQPTFVFLQLAHQIDSSLFGGVVLERGKNSNQCCISHQPDTKIESCRTSFFWKYFFRGGIHTHRKRFPRVLCDRCSEIWEVGQGLVSALSEEKLRAAANRAVCLLSLGRWRCNTQKVCCTHVTLQVA